MRHGCKNRKLSKPTDQRIALLRNSTIALINFGHMQTTNKRAKQVSRMVERVISLAKKGTLHHIRQIDKILHERKTLNKLMQMAKDGKFESKNSGFTRIVKVGLRRGDGADMVLLELISA